MSKIIKNNLYALIVAGGSGERMGASVPKQFIEIGGKPIIMHTIEKFNNKDFKCHITVVLPKNQLKKWDEMCAEYKFKIPHKTVEGGSTRFQSVRNGLTGILDDDKGIIMIHDGVRPFVDAAIIKKNISTVIEKGAALTCVDLKDSIRKTEFGKSASVNRSEYKLVQTPQSFRLSEIKKAYQRPDNILFTDDASVYEAWGGIIHLVDGSYENIKITTPEDLKIAEAFLRK